MVRQWIKIISVGHTDARIDARVRRQSQVLTRMYRVVLFE